MKNILSILTVLFAAAGSAHAAETWKCSHLNGWGIDEQGAKTSLPKDKGFSIRQWTGPDKMVVLHSESEFDKKIYETMRYKVFQNHYFGYGVVKDGVFKLSVSEVLSDTESTFTAIFESGPKTAIVKQSKCERVM